jgi:hypothetical protein
MKRCSWAWTDVAGSIWSCLHSFTSFRAALIPPCCRCLLHPNFIEMQLVPFGMPLSHAFPPELAELSFLCCSHFSLLQLLAASQLR